MCFISVCFYLLLYFGVLWLVGLFKFYCVGLFIFGVWLVCDVCVLGCFGVLWFLAFGLVFISVTIWVGVWFDLVGCLLCLGCFLVSYCCFRLFVLCYYVYIWFLYLVVVFVCLGGWFAVTLSCLRLCCVACACICFACEFSCLHVWLFGYCFVLFWYYLQVYICYLLFAGLLACCCFVYYGALLCVFGLDVLGGIYFVCCFLLLCWVLLVIV